MAFQVKICASQRRFQKEFSQGVFARGRAFLRVG